ncbi:hypothetical protein [Actinomadura sp. 6K520]|jgi:hypothetical protein|uniref:hypothetical protein n=1 Tax=Actinomadura sp. 6K520 TaxID=2530364 RepID=UPI00104A3AB6|nr:hypothetical protein [Actinomadura sp. 6K520]TDE29529.1 hypothetical protein E1289_20295 [Actinomadura sp. 6K520]
MASKPLEEVTLADLATKDDLKHLVTTEQLDKRINLVRREFKQEIGSAVNMIMGELGKIAARQEEQGRVLARLVAASDGVAR